MLDQNIRYVKIDGHRRAYYYYKEGCIRFGCTLCWDVLSSENDDCSIDLNPSRFENFKREDCPKKELAEKFFEADKDYARNQALEAELIKLNDWKPS